MRVDRMLCFIYSGAQANGDTAICRTLLLFSCQVVSDSLQPHWTAACQASVSLTISRSLPKFMSIELVIPSSHLILCCPLLLLPLIFPNMWPLFSGGKDWRMCIEKGRDCVTFSMRQTFLWVTDTLHFLCNPLARTVIMASWFSGAGS